MVAWRWVSVQATLAIHRAQISEHGGAQSVRERALLESALVRPQNLAAYGRPDLAELAASYAFGIARNRPFADGNKRAAAVVSESFVDLNNAALAATDAEIVAAFQDLASGKVAETEMADWFRQRIAGLKTS